MKSFVLIVSVLFLVTACSSPRKPARDPNAAPTAAELEKRALKATTTNFGLKMDVIKLMNDAVICACTKSDENGALSNQLGFLTFEQKETSYTALCTLPSEGKKQESCDDYQVIR